MQIKVQVWCDIMQKCLLVVQMYKTEQKSSSVHQYLHANSGKYELIFKGTYQWFLQCCSEAVDGFAEASQRTQKKIGITIDR